MLVRRINKKRFISEALSTKKGALRIDNEPKPPSKVAGRQKSRPATKVDQYCRYLQKKQESFQRWDDSCFYDG
jgi:hypothetical protein